MADAPKTTRRTLVSAERQALVWLLLLVGFVAFVAVFSGIMLPFLAGLIIAYFLDPLVDSLEKRGFSRLWATLAIVIATTVVATLVLILLVPLIVSQLRELVEGFPAQVESFKRFVELSDGTWFGDVFARFQEAMKSELGQISQTGAQILGGLLQSLWTGGLAVVNFVSLLLITPVITFYLLLDWDRMVRTVDNCLPRDHAETVRALAGEIDDVLAGFIRGQGTVALLLGIIYATGLTFVGLKYGLLIGLLAGIISFIPFVGTLTGLIIGTAFAISQFWPEWIPIAKVAAVFAVGQVIEGNFLSPKIVGDRIRLHPVWLIFALFAFSYLLGVVGLLIAVPVAAAIGVIVRFAVREYQASSLYHGAAGETAQSDGAGQEATTTNPPEQKPKSRRSTKKKRRSHG